METAGNCFEYVAAIPAALRKYLLSTLKESAKSGLDPQKTAIDNQRQRQRQRQRQNNKIRQQKSTHRFVYARDGYLKARLSARFGSASEKPQETDYGHTRRHHAQAGRYRL